MKKEKLVRKIFIDKLPYKGSLINWRKSIGCKVPFIYDNNKGLIEIIEYMATDIKHPKLKIKYNNECFIVPRDQFVKCQIGILFNKRTLNFKIKIGDIFTNNKRNLSITNKEYIKKKHGKSLVNEKYYNYTCNICGWTEGWIEENRLLRGQGCSCCSGRTVVEGINDIYTTDPWMIPIVGKEFSKTHTHSCSDKIYPVCPDCGRVSSKLITINKIYQRHSISCSCSDSISYPNKFGYMLLNQLNNIYNFNCLEHEYSPNWIEKKRYDNYFIYNDKEYILEMDGEFHKKDNKMNGQTKEESKVIDDYKDEQARLHGIEVIRIDCEVSELNYIKQSVLNNKILNALFDLSNLDWLKCGEFAESNLVKVACEYKKNAQNLTTGDIGMIMGYNYSTIRRWLIKGCKLGWCKYIPTNGRQRK